jgi:hypothetical protein
MKLPRVHHIIVVKINIFLLSLVNTYFEPGAIVRKSGLFLNIYLEKHNI